MANPQKESGHVDIANEIMDQLAKTRIPGEARQVLDFILRKTYGWQKKEDRIALSQFFQGTGLKATHIIRAVSKLRSMKLITQKGNGRGKIYRFNKNFDEWKSLPKKVITKSLPKKVIVITQKGNPLYPKKGNTNNNNTNNNNTNNNGEAAFAANPQGEFIKAWKELYKAKTGQEYDAGDKDYALIAKKIKKFGLSTAEEKAKLLFEFCNNSGTWFAKSMADFTIGKLSSHWNEIIEEAKDNGRKAGVSRSEIADFMSGRE